MNEMRKSELGGARLSFLITVVIIAIAAYAGYLYIPIAYQANTLKDFMQHQCDMAVARGYGPNWVADQLVKSAAEYDLPKTAEITPAQKDNRIEVRVHFIKPIEFPGYTYQYEFDHTAKSTSFLSVK